MPLLRHGGGVTGHVGTALVNDGHHAHGHGGLFDDHAGLGGGTAAHLSHRIGQVDESQHPIRHTLDALLCQQQAIHHDGGDGAFGIGAVGGVGGQNIFTACHQGICHGAQGVVFHFGAGGAQRFLGFLSLD